MNENIKKDPGVIHVKVTVTQNSDGTFHDEFDPKVIKVTESDTVLVFRLSSKTADDIIIRSVEIAPDDQDQLSEPSISKNGKQVTLTDINTIDDKFNLTFSFQNRRNEMFALSAKASADKQMAEQYPEIENIPPP